MSFIDNYIVYTKFHSAPVIFNKWLAIAILSSILERSVYIHLGYRKIFPNLHVILVSDINRQIILQSISIATNLMKVIDYPPKLILKTIKKKELVKLLSVKSLDEIDPYKCAVCSIHSACFSNNDDETKDLMQVLTDGYNNLLANLECSITLTGYIHEAWIRQEASETAREIGFSETCNFIYSNDMNNVKEINISEINKMKIELVTQLNRIRILGGSVETILPYNFSLDTARKLAMICALADEKLIIEDAHYNLAVQTLSEKMNGIMAWK